MPEPALPVLPTTRIQQLLEPPRGPVRLIIDTDTHNEIDDQFTLAWALLSPEALELEGTLAAPYSFAHHRVPLLAAFEDLQRGEGAGGIVTAPHMPVPFSPPLEDAYIPSPEKVAAAVRRTRAGETVGASG